MRSIKVAWWNDVPNFGDALTPVLLKRFKNIKAIWSEPEDSELVGIGSYLEKFSGYKGIIWGTGKMFEKTVVNLWDSKVLALRGELSLRGSHCFPVTLGDPVLLCRFLQPESVKKEYEVGIIPHWNDRETEKNFKDRICLKIDITAPIDDVIRNTASCKNIISSSLHGLVLADALGIPRLWYPSDMNPGDGFKFRDYQTVLGGEIKPHVWYTADSAKVDEICEGLLKALDKI